VNHSLVQRSRVDDRLCGAIRTEHDQQVRHHGGLALIVQLDDVVLR
jgi:hypothetical protein